MAGAVAALMLAPAGPAAAQDQGGAPAGDAAEAAEPAAAPEAPILTLDQDRLFRESAFGRAALARAEADTASLAAENRRIETALEAEERALTERRKTLAPADFAPLAAEFDTRVEDIRAAQAAKSRDITARLERERQEFFAAAVPILGELMSETGAVAILSEQAIILSLSALDITDRAVARLDDRLPPPEGSPAPPDAPPGDSPDAPPGDSPAAPP